MPKPFSDFSRKTVIFLSVDNIAMSDRFYRDIIEEIREGRIKTKEDLHIAKIRLCRIYNMSKIPPDSEILKKLPEGLRKDEFLEILRKKPSRTASGVAVVAVMTSPERCPHGRCTPCPGGIETNTPQSYTGFEPATMRAIESGFDPFLQTRNRIEQLRAIGHAIDKIDFIIMGGTFMARDPFYREWFIKRCYDGMNDSESKDLESAKRKNEYAKSRCIGLTIETRPDWCRINQIEDMLRYGATRVEIGVQTVFDSVLEKIERGHTVYDSILATRLARDAGLKVCYHMMPGLPGSDLDMDLESFRMIFEDPEFKPDMLKIYPTLVIKGTRLYEMWKRGEYKPLETSEIVELLIKVKSILPDWIRIQRIERDVPSDKIDAGIKESNLRQIVKEEMGRRGLRCRCIRCREIGFTDKSIEPTNLKIHRIDYTANEGEEVFLSFEDREKGVLLGYLRLRSPGRPYIEEIYERRSMIIRELKVVGREIEVGKRSDFAIQHRGIGRMLMEEAEKIAKEEFDCDKILVLSGVGAKDYYRKLGYRDDGFYLSKILK